jgi:hypothetical protein
MLPTRWARPYGDNPDEGYCNDNCNQEGSKMIIEAAYDQLRTSGAPGARTQNPRIKSPLLYH